MNSATALHTRATCNECGDVPATRETDGGIIVCERCDATPAANDDVLGSILRATPLCSRCSQPAFLRVDETIVLCAECWLRVDAHLESDSSFAATPGENATADARSLAQPVSVVATNSQVPLGWSPADRQTVVASSRGNSCDAATVTNSSSCGRVEADTLVSGLPLGGGESRHFPELARCQRAGAAPRPQDSNPDSASAPPPAIADASSKLATLRRDAVFSSGDLDFDAEVSALEVEMGWRAPPKYDATSASFAVSDSAENSKSSSVAGA